MTSKLKYKKIQWFAGWQSRLFQLAFSPVYFLFRLIFKRYLIMIVCPLKDNHDSEISRFRDTYDYVRCRALGFVVEMIKEKKVEGALAEAGVFRGEFAKRIGQELPERELYLYDTFEGFSESQVKNDLDKNFTTAKDTDAVGNFQDTSVEQVLANIPNRQRCKIRKGFFPSTIQAEDRELKFSFVSLDMDLYEPTLEGLRFFYTRLSPGGYIFIHDYNQPIFEGVRAAVDDFEKENGPICKIPLPDAGGTLIISK